jgi:hypothetical protein
MSNFLTIYYLLISLIFLNIQGALKHFDYQNQIFSWLNLWKTNISLTYANATLLLWFIVLLSILNAFRRTKAISIVLAILIYTFFSFLYSLGKINHSYHIWIISSFLICFFNFKSELHEKRNRLTLRLIQVTLLSHYFISGLWKLRSLKGVFYFDTYVGTALEHLAYSVAEGGQLSQLSELLVYNYPMILGGGFIILLLFQISCLIPIILDKFYSTYGIFSILFHCATGMILGIWFEGTIIAAFFFLIITEECILKRPNFITNFRKKVFRA